jgi:hypothetical protein
MALTSDERVGATVLAPAIATLRPAEPRGGDRREKMADRGDADLGVLVVLW